MSVRIKSILGIFTLSICSVLAQSGTISTYAGGGNPGSDSTDSLNQVIREVTTDGTITTVAGSGVSGFVGDGAAATLAQLTSPQGIAVGADGALYIADTGNHRIRKVTPDGVINTVAGNGTAAF